MRNTPFAVGLFAWAGLASPAVAQPNLVQPASAPFLERYTQRVPVSGHTLVGLVRSSGPGLPSTLGLTNGTIAVLAPSGTSFCVRVTTQDGRYSAENTFAQSEPPAAPGPATMATLAWPSTHQPRSDLDSIRLNELAVLVTGGPCGEPGPVLPATLGTASTSASTAEPFLQVFANTRGAATWAVLRDKDQGGPALRRVRCLRSETGDRVAFDVVCPLGTPPPGYTALQLRLEQQGRDGRSLEVVDDVTLSLPSPPASLR